ncbi:DNA cytosine methyltransferase [Candidatus Omnitrophota bacterium]
MIKAIDFFCGAGGVTCGFKQAGIDVLGGLDIDIACKETYEQNNNTKFLLTDISKMKKSILKKEFGIRQNDSDLIFIGCSPCQYYTNLKTDKTKSKESRMLIDDFREFVDYYKPGYVFIENVPGFEKKDDSPLMKFKQFLEDNNYHVVAKVLNAKYYGVPQNRRRFVLLASRLKSEIKLPEEDKDTDNNVRNSIGDPKTFPFIEAGHKDNSQFKHWAARLSKRNLKRIRKTPMNGGSRKAWADNPELQLECYKNHLGHWDVYGRMQWEKASPTITTRFNSYSNGRYGHPEQDRAISLREGATLQTFPLVYIFYSDSQTKIAKMIGNAVPPELARRIGNIISNSSY